MKPLPQRVFDIFALSRPRGLAFGDRPPIGTYCSDDGRAYGTLTMCERTGLLGVECMRRRTDQVWSLTRPDVHLMTYAKAMQALENELVSGLPPLKVPSGEPVRRSLGKVGSKDPSSVFKLLGTQSHIAAAWTLNQVYLAFPKPDQNWALDCQTGNFHTRLWEAYLLACFREQGCLVKQETPSPDFLIERTSEVMAWIEAVTANDVPYDHVSRAPGPAPADPPDGKERQIGAAAVRYAKTIKSKLQKNYVDMPHVKGMPFAIAIADFHAHGSMTWTREALMAYLYGTYGVVEGEGEDRKGVVKTVTELLGAEKIPAGLFRDPANASLSAVVFSNAATIAKFNRMGFLAGIRPPGLRMIRTGAMFDRRPGVLDPIPFSLEVGSKEYMALWPGIGESWSLELEVFHNPLATQAFPYKLLPECSHWFEQDGEINCRARYEHSILSSRTMVVSVSDKNFE
jgi:hypothetical protein